MLKLQAPPPPVERGVLDFDIRRYCKKTLEDDISLAHKPDVYILSVFGSRRSLKENDLVENIMTPILESLGRLPERVLLPMEGETSIYLEEWAHSLLIPCQVFQADFRSCGKSAAIVRDGRLEKDCTIAIVFQGQRTRRYDILSEKLARRGKRVFFITTSGDIEELVPTKV